jgi:dTDP-4-dehydrorhamnose reductase
MKRVVVTGAAGQLGSTVVDRLSPRCEIVPFTRAELDIADDEKVRATMASIAPDVVINCAAYNDVDGAESNAMAALTANSLGVRALARAAAAARATFVHYSTDFVFDGESNRPYLESDPPRPLSTYGLSKLLGEWFALEVPSAYVLRVESLFGGRPAKSSVDKILAGLRAGTPVKVFHDRTVTPSFVDDVAAATEQMLDAHAPSGIYHCVNSGTVTWLGIAEKIAALLRRETEIVPVSVDDVKLTARRPRYCALSNQKLGSIGVTLPSWTDAIERYVTGGANP